MGKNAGKKGAGHARQSNKAKERAEKARLKKERHRNSYYSDAEDREFEAQVEQIGCKIKFIAGDGNCLFRSLADQLEGKPEEHASYRAKVIGHIEEKQDMFEPYVEDDEPFGDYLVRMRQDAEWGGNQELVAASQLFKANIVVHQFKAPRFFIPFEKARVTLHLSYHGEHHYNSVRAIGDEGNGSALPITLQVPNPGTGKNGSRSSGASSPWPEQEAEVARSCPWASVSSIIDALKATGGRGEDAIELLVVARHEGASGAEAGADDTTPENAAPYAGKARNSNTNGLVINGGASAHGHAKGKGLANGNGAKNSPNSKTRNTSAKKIPRAAVCPCGSGVKYKKCCKKRDGAVARGQVPPPQLESGTTSTGDSSVVDDLGALVI